MALALALLALKHYTFFLFFFLLFWSVTSEFQYLLKYFLKSNEIGPTMEFQHAQLLFYKNSFYKNHEDEIAPKLRFCKNHTRLQITRFIRISEAHSLLTIRIIHIAGGVLLLGREIVRISIPLFINRGFHFTRISHICLLFSKWNTQPGHVLSGAELQHHHIITSKLLSQ